MQRDVIHLFSEEGGSGRTVGATFGNATYNIRNNVAWTERMTISTIAHELGHTFGALHTINDGIMSYARERYGPKYFSGISLNTIEKYISLNGTCLATLDGAGRI